VLPVIDSDWRDLDAYFASEEFLTGGLELLDWFN
jgi:hypothetical protein